MLFLVKMNVKFPDSIALDEIAEFQAREKKYSQALQRKGAIKAIWRAAGQYSNYTIFEVADNDQLHDFIEKFPMFRFMDIFVTPLAVHPNAIVMDFFADSQVSEDD